MKSFFNNFESLKSRERVPEIIDEILGLLEDNYFENVSRTEHEEGGYLFTNPKSDFEFWVDVDSGDFIIKNLEIENNNKGVGTSLVENIKEICAQNGFSRIVANKVKSTAWEFWLDKCSFEVEMDNEENAVFNFK